MTIIQYNSRQRGFSLIELMIAMVIGLLLMAGVISVFAGSRKSFDLTQEISSIQESARFAMDALSNDIRLSSYQGCAMASMHSAEIQANNAPTTNFLSTSTRGAEVDGTTFSPTLPAELNALNPAPISGSDVLMLQYASPTTFRLSTPMVGETDDITLVSNTPGLSNGDLAIISDCDAADLFAITGVAGGVIQHNASGNKSGNLSKQYSPGATPATDTTRVSKFNYISYYVGDSGRVNQAGDSIFSLFAYDMDAIKDNLAPTELIEGVENMQVLFGVRANNNTIRYISADHGAFNASRVSSIQIGLLIYSVESLAGEEDTRTYQLLNTEIKPEGSGAGSDPEHGKDHRVRIAFNSTIKVRNRREP